MSNRENLHVAILRFGEDKLERGVSFDEFRQHLEDLGFRVDPEYLKILFFHSYEVVTPREAVSGSESMSKPGVSSMLTADSYFKLIDYTELKEARESSQSARRYARGALILTAILAAVSILVTVLMPLVNPTQAVIDGTQYEQLIDLETRQSLTLDQINSRGR